MIIGKLQVVYKMKNGDLSISHVQIHDHRGNYLTRVDIGLKHIQSLIKKWGKNNVVSAVYNGPQGMSVHGLTKIYYPNEYNS